MLYQLLKIWVGLAARIFCRTIRVNHPEKLRLKGPLLIAANHPNSFLDAIMLDILFQQPVWSLARGDVFSSPFRIKLLSWLKILPVYRTSEGAENLEINYKTFEACRDIFRKGGIVLMFSEGNCINEWHLRPLKKGTARLAIGAWDDGIDLKVLPAGINYSSFRRFGKNIFLQFGSLVSREDFSATDTDGKRNLLFNERLKQELEPLVFEIAAGDREKKEENLLVQPGPAKKILLAIPALAGYVFNAPLYLLVRQWVNRRVKEKDHFDSVMTALLVFLYPFYLLLISAGLVWLTGSYWGLLALLVLPLAARAHVELKDQLDGGGNES